MTNDDGVGRVAPRSDIATDEDAELLWQATARAEEFLEGLAEGRSTAADLRALLNYLRDVVLARVAEEDRYILPPLEHVDVSHPALDQLRAEHLLLRDDIDELAAAAAPHGTHDPDQLAAVTRRLITRLDEHLRREAATLAVANGAYRAGDSGWAAMAHWYPLTEGQVIDLDQLPPDHAEDAVLNRLTSLHAGEQIELHGSDDPKRLWDRLHRRAPGVYSWQPQPDQHVGWKVSVTRRATD